MKPPTEPEVYAEWKQARVHMDSPVEVEGHSYSVPYPLVSQVREVRLTANTGEFLHKGQRVASPLRSHPKGRHTTVPEPMPKAHQAYAHWTPPPLIHWAEQTGPAIAEAIATILASRPHAQQGFRASLGVTRLGKSSPGGRLPTCTSDPGL